MGKQSLGYSESEKSNSPYAHYFRPHLSPMQHQVTEAIACGGLAHELLWPVHRANELLKPGYWPIETGYARTPDLGIHVFCLTNMPRVTPEMWNWWFGWHGDEASKYKLWHPHAHLNAQWKDGQKGVQGYVGRTSHITEYLGSEIKKGAVMFVSPKEMGIDEVKAKEQGEVFICARVGLPGLPLKAGWLLHQIRPTEGGAEMRSRMWFGGANATLGNKPGPLRKLLAFLIRPLGGFLLPNPQELLAHNAQEMQHLAEFLPELYAEFGPNK